ncbi:MAG: aminotransferase class I/II-fold pyridoxal phosphate-dependent enzyme [PVC group bacterium]
MPYPRFRINMPLGELFLSLLQEFKNPRPGSPETEFLDRFRKLGEFPETVLVGSGRVGFRLLLESLNIETGAEIIFPAYTFHPIPAAAAECGFKPVFADVDPGTWNIDPEKISPLVNRRTKAIVPTHLFGVPAEMDRINEIAREHGLKVIEDCAHGLGARYNGRPAGTLGDAALFTFAMSKNLPCWGGGAMTVKDPDLAKRMRAAIEDDPPSGGFTILKGQAFNIAAILLTQPLVFPWTLYPFLRLAAIIGSDRFDRPFLEEVVPLSVSRDVRNGKSGTKSFSPFQAAVGLRQLKRFPRWLEKQEANARLLRSRLEDCRVLRLQREPPGTRSSFLYLRARVEDPKKVRRALLHRGVDTKPDDMRNCAGLEIFAGRCECPTAARLGGRCIELPCSPFYSGKEIEDIAGRVSEALEDN